ncbi:hypothetical protein ACJX0J_010758, partial [Zea mays]
WTYAPLVHKSKMLPFITPHRTQCTMLFIGLNMYILVNLELDGVRTIERVM